MRECCATSHKPPHPIPSATNNPPSGFVSGPAAPPPIRHGLRERAPRDIYFCTRVHGVWAGVGRRLRAGWAGEQERVVRRGTLLLPWPLARVWSSTPPSLLFSFVLNLFSNICECRCTDSREAPGCSGFPTTPQRGLYRKPKPSAAVRLRVVGPWRAG